MTAPSYHADTGDVVVDEKGTQFRLGRLLGRGGQGAVYEVEGGRFAVKTINGGSVREREALRNRLEYVRRLDLSGLPIARPRTMLKQPVGYVMDLLDGVIPLGNLSRPPRGTPPESLIEWHVKGGGLRKRLASLAHLADTLAQLGGRALVYGDLSPANAMVSEDPRRSETWLIDPDNLGRAGRSGNPTVYTPRYGAPELVRGDAPPSPDTDAHAFAVLAFETLTLSHPLIGDAVADAEPDVEASALQGDWPYVHHPTESRNRRSTGLPLEGVTTKGLRELFQRAFVDGLANPSRRPRPEQWRDELFEADDLTVLEPETGATTIPDSSRRCFWTGQSLGPLAFGTFRRWVPDPNESDGADLRRRIAHGPVPIPGRVQSASWGRFLLSSAEPFVLTRRHVHCETGPESEGPCLQLEYDATSARVRITPRDEGAYSLFSSQGPVEIPRRGIRVRATADSTFGIHLGPLDEPHRFVQVKTLA